MTTHVANRLDARAFVVDDGVMDEFADLKAGDLIELGGEKLIIIDPPAHDGRTWKFTAAPALEVGRETGTA